MTGTQYKVFGGSTAHMHGRKQELATLVGRLTKSSPDHVSVVAPKHYGKTLLLKAFKKSLENDHKDIFLAVVYWDLRHTTPKTDLEFRQQFVELLGKSLMAAGNSAGELVDTSPETVSDSIKIILDELESSQDRILVLMDGFDAVLEIDGIGRHVWDELRALSQKESLWLVTGSRKPLQDLCRSEESRTSDFWQVFGVSPLVLGCLQESERDGVLISLTNQVALEESARKELWNWTGGIPLLVSGLADYILQTNPSGSVNNTGLNELAGSYFSEGGAHLLEELWRDLPLDSQYDLAALAEADQDPRDLPRPRVKLVVQRGLAKGTDKKLSSCCRAMAHFARTQSGGLADLKRLFNSKSLYLKNMQALLELRLSRISRIDPGLITLLSNAIENLSDPIVCIASARGFTISAFSLIWKLECEEDGRVPLDWEKAWNERSTAPLSDRRPPGGGAQCRLLQTATGSYNGGVSLTKVITKEVYTLLDCLQKYGDYGQHYEGETPTYATSVSFCMTALCFLEAMDRLMEGV